MQHPGFFDRAGPFKLSAIGSAIGAELGQTSDGDLSIEDLRPLNSAGPNHLTFFENRKYVSQLGSTMAGACILARGFASKAPEATAILLAPAP